MEMAAYPYGDTIARMYIIIALCQLSQLKTHVHT